MAKGCVLVVIDAQPYGKDTYLGLPTGKAFINVRNSENEPATIMMYVQAMSLSHLPRASPQSVPVADVNGYT